MAGTLLFGRTRKNDAAETRVIDTPQSETQREKAEICAGGSRVQMIFMLSPDEITPNPSQPRKFFTEEAILRLADSIRIHGMIQPLAVRRPEGARGYELVAGERRLRAAKLLGMPQVPCIPVEADSEESAHLAIIENIQRENLNMFEQAQAIFSLMQIHCLTQEKIASQLSCSQSYVANKLRLLRISPRERDEILTANLTERHVRALLRIKDAERRQAVMHTLIRRGLNVAATEEYIDRILESDKEKEDGEEDVDDSSSTGRHQETKLVIRDVRLLYNTIDKAVETMRLTGMPIETVRRETQLDTEIVIRIPKSGVMDSPPLLSKCQ